MEYTIDPQTGWRFRNVEEFAVALEADTVDGFINLLLGNRLFVSALIIESDDLKNKAQAEVLEILRAELDASVREKNETLNRILKSTSKPQKKEEAKGASKEDDDV